MWEMNVEHLEYFVTVAQVGSINKAAQALFISQPHLGKILRDLEDEVGVILLQRTRHGVSVTPEGMEFLKHAKKMLAEFQEIRELKCSVGRDDNALEVSMTKFSHIMESFIATVLRHKDEPEFSHQLNEGSPQDVVDDVFSNLSKVGVLNFDTQRKSRFLANLESKHLEYCFLAHVEPHILVAEDHPLIKAGKPVNLQTLAEYGFVRYIGQYEDFANRIRSEQGVRNLNNSKRIVYTHGRSTLLHMIGNSDFYGIGIYDFRVQESVYNVRSIPIENCTGSLEFGYIYPRGQALSSISREFIDDLKERLSTIK